MSSAPSLEEADLLSLELPAWAQPLFVPRRFKVLYGGRGSGKSWTVARALIIKASTVQTRILCCRETQESLAASVHRLLADQIIDSGIQGWTIQRERIYHANGSEFTFAGIRTDPRKIKSSEGVDIVWVEEAETVSKESWDILIPTIRKPGSEIWITFNPRERDDPTYSRFVANPPDNALVLLVNWRDNPWFPAELEVERRASAERDPDEYSYVWEGQPKMRRDTQVMAHKWRVTRFEPKEAWNGPYYGLDFGFAKDPAFAVECWIGEGNLWIRREAVAKPGTQHVELDHLGPFLLAHFAGIEERELRADSSRPENINYLSRHGLPLCLPCHKWAGSIEDGISWMRAHDWVVIHSECPEMIYEAAHWQYKTDRYTGEILKQIEDKHNHGWDAVRYALDAAIRGEAHSGKAAKLTFGSTRATTAWGI